MNPWDEMEKHLTDWRDEVLMDHYPDALYSDSTQGYMYALTEMLDYVMSKKEEQREQTSP